METILTFGEDEQDQAMLAQLGPRAFSKLWDINNEVRGYFKHMDSSVENAENVLERIQEMIYEDGIMEFYN